jgi:methylated-DNA-protein-cysteine methyltransferase related protein
LPNDRRPFEYTGRVKSLIRAIPPGKVASYGQIAALAGMARQARQVAWILHSSSEKDRLPWHRVIGAAGRISLPPGRGGREQRRLLVAEGIRFGPGGRVDWAKFRWEPKTRSRIIPFDVDALDD